jgi:hypothetical protein
MLWQAVVLGYGTLPLFVKYADTSLSQPLTPNEPSIALNAGAFQLPLHLGSELVRDAT